MNSGTGTSAADSADPAGGGSGRGAQQDYRPFIIGALLAGVALAGRAVRDYRRSAQEDLQRRQRPAPVARQSQPGEDGG